MSLRIKGNIYIYMWIKPDFLKIKWGVLSIDAKGVNSVQSKLECMVILFREQLSGFTEKNTIITTTHPSYPFLYSNHLAECLAYTKKSIHVYWITQRLGKEVSFLWGENGIFYLFHSLMWDWLTLFTELVNEV